MTILSMPDEPGFRAVRFGLHTNTRTHTSPLTGKVQVQELQGARWVASFSLPPMPRSTARRWAAFLLRLRGHVGEFYAGDPLGQESLALAKLNAEQPAAPTFDNTLITFDSDLVTFDAGVFTSLGTPVVNGASQTGSSLVTDGWTPDVTVALTGDYIAFDTPSGKRELHMVVEDAVSDSSGNATLTIEPPLRESPADDEAIIIEKTTCVMRLAEQDVGWDADTIALFGITFNAVEAL